jgi:putative FmdB family regulatory protein
MPIYEYSCESCNHKLEKLQRLGDPALTDCPECGKSALRRLVSAPGFRLKGGGWYETDFKQSNQRNLAESDSSPSAGKTNGEDSTPAPAAPAAAAKSAEPATKTSTGSATDAA